MKIDYKIIKDYLDGDGTSDEKISISGIFADYHSDRSLRNVYKRYWDEMPDTFEMAGYDEERVLGKIYREIKLNDSKAERIPRSLTYRLASYFARVAAILLIPLAVFILINYDRMIQPTVDTYAEIYAPSGTQIRFNLPDGSEGYLNSGSKLRFPNIFKGNTRKVELEGEAFFKVVSNPKIPFVVSGREVNVVAYGTSFNVDAYPEDNLNKVTLLEGKVEVLGKSDDKIQSFGFLTPGQMCRFDVDKSAVEISEVDASRIISWKDGKLTFINEPFGEVVKKLNRRYGVHIVIKDEKLKEHKYLATFENETLDEVLKLIEISAPIEITDMGRVNGVDGSFGKRTIEFRMK